MSKKEDVLVVALIALLISGLTADFAKDRECEKYKAQVESAP